MTRLDLRLREVAWLEADHARGVDPTDCGSEQIGVGAGVGERENEFSGGSVETEICYTTRQTIQDFAFDVSFD